MRLLMTSTIIAICLIVGLSVSVAAPMNQSTGMLADIVYTKSSQRAPNQDGVNSLQGIYDNAAQMHQDLHEIGVSGHKERSGDLLNVVYSASTSSRGSGTGGLEDLFRAIPQHANHPALRTDQFNSTPNKSSEGGIIQVLDSTDSQSPSQASLRVYGAQRNASVSRRKRLSRFAEVPFQPLPTEKRRPRKKKPAPPLPEWMKTNLPNGLKATGLYKVYEDHTGCVRTTSIDHIRTRCTPEYAKELLSGNVEREKAVIKAMGIPEGRKKRKRLLFLGDDSEVITKAFADHHGITDLQATMRLDKRLTEPIANLLKKKETFKQGADMLPWLQKPYKYSS